VAREARKSGKVQLALAVARGISIAKWARANDVPAPTAYGWAREPEFRRAVETYRRRTIDEAIGRMTRNSTRAADLILNMAERADSESVRLRAARAIFAEMISVSKYSGLEARLHEAEEMLDASAASTTGWSAETDEYGVGFYKPGARPANLGETGAA
jgi:hypothetical protein